MQVYQNQELEINPIDTIYKHDSRSKRFDFVNSKDIINQIVGHGFTHITTSHAKVRKTSKAGFQKHIMIFEHPKFKIDDENQLQLLVTNAHDGTSSLKFNLGVFRTVCANGLVVGDSFKEVRIRHIATNKGIYTTVLEDILKESGNFVELIQKMRNTQLTYNQMNVIKDAAAKMKFRNIDNLKELDRFQFLEFKRGTDSGTDLWTVFNVVQEKMIRGGIKYSRAIEKLDDQGNKSTKIITNTTREVKRFSELEYLNKEIWNVAEKLVA